MRRLSKHTFWLFCALLMLETGCWMNGNTRPSAPQPGLSPSAPTLHSPQYGPVGPLPSNGPAVDGPVLEGPAFPPSSEGFDRKRHSQKQPQGHPGSEYAGTEPPPFVLDGPIAKEKPKHPERTIGFIELPPSP